MAKKFQQHLIEKTFPKGFELDGDTYVEIFANIGGSYPFTVRRTLDGQAREITHGLWVLRDAIKQADAYIEHLKMEGLIRELASDRS